MARKVETCLKKKTNNSIENCLVRNSHLNGIGSLLGKGVHWVIKGWLIEEKICFNFKFACVPHTFEYLLIDTL